MKKTNLFTVVLVSAVVLLGKFTVYAIEERNKVTLNNYFNPAEISVGVVENTDNTEVVTKKDYTLTESTDDTDTLSVYKPVQILNVNATNTTNADAFIRVAIVPMWVTDNSASSNFVVGAMDNIIDNDDNNKILETQPEEKEDTNPHVTYKSDNDNEYLDITTFTDFKNIQISGNTFTNGDVTFTLNTNWKQYWIYNPNDGYFYYKYVVKVGEKTEPLLQSVSIENSKLYRYNKDSISLQVDILADSVQVVSSAEDDVWSAYGIVKTTEAENAEVTHPYGYVLETTKEDTN